MNPSDIDFAVSWTFWRGLSCLHGWGDPGSNIPEPQPDYSALEERVTILEGKRGQVYQSIESQYNKSVIKPQPPKPKRGREDITDRLYR